MINWIYIVYCLAAFAYTGNAIITTDRALAIFMLGFVELILDLFLIFYFLELKKNVR